MSEDNELYCAECGDSEYDEDGDYSHDYKPYNHDFEPEDYGITTENVKDGFDILGKAIDVWGKYKKSTQTSQSYPTYSPQLTTHYQPNIPAPKKDHEMHNKLNNIHDSISIGKRIERRRWIIGIGISVLAAIIIALAL